MGGFELALNRVHTRADVSHPKVFGINFPEWRVLFDRFVHERLGDRGVVHFAMAVAAIADQVYDNVAAELVAVLRCDASDSQDSVDILAVHVKNGNRLPPRQLRGKVR